MEVFYSGARKIKTEYFFSLKKRRNSFEPDLNQRPKDDILITTVLRSTNWAIEGIDVFLFQSRIKLSEKKV